MPHSPERPYLNLPNSYVGNVEFWHLANLSKRMFSGMPETEPESQDEAFTLTQCRKRSHYALRHPRGITERSTEDRRVDVSRGTLLGRRKEIVNHSWRKELIEAGHRL